MLPSRFPAATSRRIRIPRVNEGQRYIAHRSLAGLLAAKGDALRPGLTEDEAADVIFTLLSPEVYLPLTVVRGWPPARWQDWTADTIARAILRLPMMAARMRPAAALATAGQIPPARTRSPACVLSDRLPARIGTG